MANKYALGILAIAAFCLTGCGASGDDAVEPNKEASTAADAGASAGGDEGSGGAEASEGAISGTGTFVIGSDIAYGDYQLVGETTQPDGCTWQILQADGSVFVENQGAYVFITDVPEAVTFVTEGCPGWETQ